MNFLYHPRMPETTIFPLNTSAAQAESLRALQELFASACNDIAPTVQATRCWNRVALHHLTYKGLRERYPQLGSQMACNAIYSVCRFARVVYQHPNSPWHIAGRVHAPLPLLRFMPDAPVYFDRHTLSIRSGRLSLFTLDGRMRFQLDLSAALQERFRNERLREIALHRNAAGFALHFHFSGDIRTEHPVAAWEELPGHLVVEADGGMSAPPSANPLPLPAASPA